MPTQYSAADVPNWRSLSIGPRALSMSMWGSNISLITEDNTEKVAKYIAEQEVLFEDGSDIPVSYEELLPIIEKWVGFKRSWY